MVEIVEQSLKTISSIIWGVPTILLLILSGVGLTIYLSSFKNIIQIKTFLHGIHILRGKYDDKNAPGEITHFQALTTALSATIGLGNIGIVAIIIKEGGPGAVFWMISAGFIGMATKFAEASLATIYRSKNSKETFGGPMYYIEKGLGKKFKPMAIFYALAIIIGSFGISNMFQTNQAALVLYDFFDIPKILTGIFMSVLCAIVILGGIKRIAKVTSFIVPFMAVIYLIGCIIILSIKINQIPSLFLTIFESAFQKESIYGGLSFSFYMALIQGIKRACFSNEAGLGSAAIAHSAVSTNEPIREGCVASLEPLIDTVIICTMSALVILSTGVWQNSESIGVSLTATAFDSVISGFGSIFIPIAATLFAFSTLISWSYYGVVAINYLYGKKMVTVYKVSFCLFALLGAIWEINSVLDFSDIMIGLMIFPNLIAIWLLAPKLKKSTRDYFKRYEHEF